MDVDEPMGGEGLVPRMFFFRDLDRNQSAAGRGARVPSVTELRVALTVSDFDEAVQFYRDVLGLEQIADWSSDDGSVVVLEAGRATLELLDEAQADYVDRVEAGRRVAGPVHARARGTRQRARPPHRLIEAGAERVAEAGRRRGATATRG